jgi:hypothetical protein
MHLADYRVAGDTTEAASNLARAQAVGPQLLEKLDTIFSPPHFLPPRTFFMRIAFGMGIRRPSLPTRIAKPPHSYAMPR